MTEHSQNEKTPTPIRDSLARRLDASILKTFGNSAKSITSDKTNDSDQSS